MKKNHDEASAKIRQIDYSKIWFKKAIEALEGLSFSSVMDIGAGKGEFLKILVKKFRPNEVWALDYVETNLQELRRAGFNIIEADLDNLGFERFDLMRDKLDLIVCLETAEHIFNLDHLFILSNHVLKEGGFLLITTPNMSSFSAKFFYLINGFPFAEGHHVRFLTKKKLYHYGFFNGFNIVKYNNYFTFQTGVIARTIGVRDNFWIKFWSIFFFWPFFIFSKLRIFDSFSNDGLVAIFQKTNFSPLTMDVENFKINFNSLSGKEKDAWRMRMRKFIVKNKMREYVYLGKEVNKFIEDNE